MVSRRISWAAATLVAGLALALAAGAQAAKAIVPATGLSTAKDPKAAGTEAAQKAKAALAGQQPKVVLVYTIDVPAPDAARILEGAASVFDPALIYGCNGYAPVSHETCEGRVVVLALAGDVAVTTAVAETKGKDDDLACGKRIGEALKDAAAVKSPGRVLLLFGDCHIPRDDQVAKGAVSVLGHSFPIVGGAAKNGLLYVKAKTQKGANLGVLITGSFTCGLSLKKDMTPDGLISSARDAFTEAIGNKKDKLALMLVFDCGGRRGAMLKNKSFPKEIEAMKSVAGDVPIFGFYGSGEIGCPGTGAPARGVGYHISACALFAE